jgi:phosphopantetheine--protein transferase-like protein
MIKCGIDLVFIPDFKKRVARGGAGFLKRIFLESELKNTEVTHLAGVFAAKEVVMKALGIKAGDWHKIEVSYDKNGKPKARILGKKVKNCDLSISHAGDYAVAVFVTEV